MNSKPKIYGTCDAGCRWRVPHYSELEGAAALLPVYPDASGNYRVEVGEWFRFDVVYYGVNILLNYILGDYAAPVNLTSDRFYGVCEADEYNGLEVRFCGIGAVDDSYKNNCIRIIATVEIMGWDYHYAFPQESAKKRFQYEIAQISTSDMQETQIAALLAQGVQGWLTVSAAEGCTISAAYKKNNDASATITTETADFEARQGITALQTALTALQTALTALQTAQEQTTQSVNTLQQGKQDTWINGYLESQMLYTLNVGGQYKIIPKATIEAGTLSLVAMGANGEGRGAVDIDLTAYAAGEQILFSITAFEKYNETTAQVYYTINGASNAVQIAIDTTVADVPSFEVHGDVMINGASVLRTVETAFIDIEAALRTLH